METAISQNLKKYGDPRPFGFSVHIVLRTM